MTAMSRFRRDTMGVDTHPPVTDADGDGKPDLSPWQWLDELSERKTTIKDAKSRFNFKSYSPRLMNRVLCGDRRLVPIAEMMVDNKAIQEPEAHYEFLFAILDKVKYYPKWYFVKEDSTMSDLRREWCEAYERGTNDFYSASDSRHGVDKMREILTASKGGMTGKTNERKTAK